MLWQLTRPIKPIPSTYCPMTYRGAYPRIDTTNITRSKTCQFYLYNFVLKLSHNISFLEGYIFLENMWTSQFGYSTNLTQISHYYNIHIIIKECSTTELEIYHDTKKILILRLIHTHTHTHILKRFPL
jgi:hypothetical protein